jgi:epoxyqueuosine reductase
MPGSHHFSGRPLVQRLQGWARELGFSQIGISGIDLASAEPGLRAWLDAGFHGSMAYMAVHGLKRARPAELVPGTVCVISARMDYLPLQRDTAWVAQEEAALQDPQRAVVSLYARGRDYHKVMRQRLQRLADQLAAEVGPRGHRVFTDSAPVLEVELATRAGLAWRGKHTLALSREAGSMFFLGEIFIDLALPLSEPTSAHCGSCTACVAVCPTQAIVAPYRLDARRCISYLTIEQAGAIDPDLRPLVGNRIYGCDDCQLACPWNKYAQRAALPDFDERHGLGSGSLLQLWAWSEADFLQRTEGSAMRRVGWTRWRRNLAVALGNGWRETGDTALAQALVDGLGTACELVQEHITWALAQRSAALLHVQAQAPRLRTSISHAGSATMPSSVDTVTKPAV